MDLFKVVSFKRGVRSESAQMSYEAALSKAKQVAPGSKVVTILKYDAFNRDFFLHQIVK